MTRRAGRFSAGKEKLIDKELVRSDQKARDPFVFLCGNTRNTNSLPAKL